MATGPVSCVTPATIPAAGSPSLLAALLLLSKPGIVLAEVLAGLAGMLLAAPAPSSGTVIPVLLAIALAAGGAAMLNGVLDAAADRQMARLERRSRALEMIGSVRVMIIALSLIGLGLGLAAMTVPPLALLLLAGGCFAYLWLYTAWLKYRSPWGVLAGGIPGAVPPLIGAAAVSGGLTASSLLLAVFIFIWQLPHFWLLALECRHQYARAGIPVLPLTHGEAMTKSLTLATSLLLLPCTLALGHWGGLSAGYMAGAWSVGLLLPLILANCIYRTLAYRRGFRVCLGYLLVIISAICADRIFFSGSFDNW